MNIIKKFFTYCQTCYNELAHQVTWPSRQELTGSAVLVLTASLIIALVVLAMDKIWGLVTDVLYMGI
ncbi:preprotein translocase subunit SecE [Prevotella sp. E13-17]|uniref:preprotein translocase subunit SecE n=1 Tax=Prevotella sp. E13-17 TaxID=2913616 RepID=UPI000A89081F|nr:MULTISPECIES: preprotein translocase subunit SecE [Prevotellaceae]UKK51351.1 preprotein translocase subunit SecE [Prevotella sp. E13-17]